MSHQWARRRLPRAGAAGCAALLLALLVPLTGCAPTNSTPARYPDVQRMLDTRARAVQHRDAAGFLATVDPRATGYRDRQRAMFAHLAGVPLAEWHYELDATGAFPLAAGETDARLAAKVQLRYRFRGYDTSPVHAVQYLTLTRRDGRWLISSDTDGAAAGKSGTRQLWDQGPVRLVRGRYSLVLGDAAHLARLKDLAHRVDRAVPAVSAVWKGKWSRKVVVEAPDSVERMAQLMGSDDASGYAGIAAVTTGEAGVSTPAPADRVIVNPEAYEELNDLGRTVVLTHETTHVATRTATTTATPLWLSEGFADWVAYRGSHRKPAATAPELTRAVARGTVPARLPTDADFGFKAGADRLAKAYEGSWLACRMIAGKWGEDRLVAFYRAAGQSALGVSSGSAGAPMEAATAATAAAAGSPTAARAAGPGHRPPVRADRTDRALRSQLGIGIAEFTRLWRAYVRAQLRR
ncbi:MULTISPECIES: hypothetical protein [unclassified Streptomyces]|uniref:hypothetical protein n=1 Tax=unclassified Streptomyces TaxID=2593676 RepID=UPI000887C927|nr:MULTISPECIES: hypothetical protein [unclassified Streptomyces]PBC81954.1 hypothetical protein BX261_1836 [Streptomyces sp. 2321.6]SDR52255.1 hypothetical protein SAMN05216511_5379 [Streptomyces sp. KS_16]SEC37593.1 hypothetical protein SAMN05428940_1838 [Streptomyces sp. 2133.1]SEF03570.1 hypothetical protein SAMN05428954_5441 [Streptomyces sp. 2112.3]SNC67003.1 hypothetical protein SAMN06272741_1833 [Streptomyces sp. 2114.4]